MYTVLKCHDFAITQFLREINYVDFTSANYAIITHLQALNFDFQEFLHFSKVEMN